MLVCSDKKKKKNTARSGRFPNVNSFSLTPFPVNLSVYYYQKNKNTDTNAFWWRVCADRLVRSVDETTDSWVGRSTSAVMKYVYACQLTLPHLWNVVTHCLPHQFKELIFWLVWGKTVLNMWLFFKRPVCIWAGETGSEGSEWGLTEDEELGLTSPTLTNCLG